MQVSASVDLLEWTPFEPLQISAHEILSEAFQSNPFAHFAKAKTLKESGKTASPGRSRRSKFKSAFRRGR